MPRSTSGVAAAVESDRGSLLVAESRSVSQKLCADSTASAETVACHTGVKECIHPPELVLSTQRVLNVHVDNASAIRAMSRGASLSMQIRKKSSRHEIYDHA